MYSVECARISFFTRLVQKGRIFRPCFLSSACFKNWTTLSPSAKSENMFWYFGWHKRIFKAKCLIPLFRYHHLQVLYFCRNGEPVSKKEKKKCTSQASQPRVSKREKKKCRSQASQLPVSNFEPDLHFWRRALRAKYFQIWTEMLTRVH